MAVTPLKVNPSKPNQIASASFSTERKGFDRSEVRALLDAVAGEISRLQENNERLAEEVAELRVRPDAVLDEATVTALLGQEAARVLSTAREAAALTQARAEDQAARMLQDAHDDAARLREQAAMEAGDEIEAAKAEGRQMVHEARAVRERMLSDLSRRREAGRGQIADLQEHHQRIVAALESTQAAVAEVTAKLRAAAPWNDAADLDDTPPPSITGEHVVVVLDEVIVDEAAAVEEAEVVDIVDLLVVDAAATVAADDDGDDAPARETVLLFAGELDGDDAVVTSGSDGSHESDDSDDSDDSDGSEVLEGSDGSARADASGDEVTANGRPSVGDLFARIRAANPDVEHTNGDDHHTNGDAAHVGAAPTAADVDVDAVGVEEPVAAEPVVDDAGASAAAVAAVLAERAAVLAPLQASLARRFKRALADEQNEVLDDLRRTPRGATLEGTFGTVAQQAERYRNTAEDDLWAAATAGARSLADLDDAALAEALDRRRALDDTLDEITAELVEPLRERLARCVEEGDGDPPEVAALARGAYREWKSQRLDALAEHFTLAAHGRGAFAALVPGTPIQWVADPNATPCPDADDNALAGAVAAGEPFPTGHLHAPAYAGCRCGIATTHS